MIGFQMNPMDTDCMQCDCLICNSEADSPTPAQNKSLVQLVDFLLGMTSEMYPPPFDAVKPVVTKPQDPEVAAFLANHNNGIFYMGGNTVAFAIEGTRRNFVDVAIAHLGNGEQFVRATGRKLAIRRVVAGNAITLRLPSDINGTADRSEVIDFLRNTFINQHTDSE